MNKQEKILITGGAGFIGSRLSEYAIKNGCSVVVLDNLSPQIHGENGEIPELLCNLPEQKFKFIYGDVRNESDWLQALEGVNKIVHLAAETGTGQSMYEVEKYCHVNIGGTAILMNLIANRKINVDKIVVASSRSIYGEGKYKNKNGTVVYPKGRADNDMAKGSFECICPDTGLPLIALPTDEESKIHPVSIYGITKSTQEQLVIETAKNCGITAVALRYQNVYGPGQSLNNPYTGILSIFSNLMLSHNDVNIFEDGLESRDFVYIDDVVDATFKAVMFDKKITDVYNVGSGCSTDVLTIASKLKKIYGSDSTLRITGNYRAGDIRHNLADLTKIKQTFNFTPEVTFDEGVTRFAEWVLKKGAGKSGYEQSLYEMKSRGLLK